MQAFVTCPYGSSELGQLQEIDRPAPAADEVLVRVRATSINPYDWHHLTGEPRIARSMPGGLGLRHPRYRVLGCDMAGTVEAVGVGVSRFRPGDDVFALLSHGGFAEYVTVREDMLAAKPDSLSYEEAAAVPMAAITALLALRDKVEPGQRVLVNGASGGVGTFAVQIARAFGAHVVGVCGKRNIDLVRSIGADDVVDYRSEDFTRQERQYDLLLDIAGGRSLAACRKALAPKGTFVVVGGPAGRWLQPAWHAFGVLLTAPLLGRRAVLADTVHHGKQQDLVTLTELIEAGKVTPVIDRCYPFDEIPAAIEYQEAGHASGKVVVTV
ncbi:NAD(P)-dependent alcohol dehydrogenase [Nocardia sp. NPDC051787]|uniref:NAD(P)-dependent alcohol dehydrogenase n=1 Tax=Nocardia sp. NPDC051787 TaxID=3155415 RepID=UPI00343613F8